MRDSCRGRHVAVNLDRAVDDVLKSRRSGSISSVSVRMAANRYGLPPSTVQASITRQRRFKKPAAPGRSRALISTEEKVIVDDLLKYADRGLALNSSQVAQAMGTFIESLPEERRISLPFKQGVPGRRYVSIFMKRHRDQIVFVKPCTQEGKSQAAVTA